MYSHYSLEENPTSPHEEFATKGQLLSGVEFSFSWAGGHTKVK